MKQDTVKHKRIRPFTLIIILLLGVSTFAFLSLMPINISSMAPGIKSRIEASINGKVEMGRLSLHVLPYPRLRLDGFTLSTPDEVILKAKRVNMEFSLLGLLVKKLKITKFVILDANILVRRNKDGTINFATLKKETPQPEATKLKLRDFQLKRAHFTIIDETEKGPVTFNLDNVTAYLGRGEHAGKYHGGGRLRPDTTFLTSGEYTHDAAGFTVFGDLTLEGFDLDTLKPFFSEEDIKKAEVTGIVSTNLEYAFGGKDYLQAKGMVKGNVNTRKLDINLPTLLAGPLSSPKASSHVRLEWKDKELLLDLENMDVELDRVGISGSAKLIIPDTGLIKQIELDIATTPVKASELRELILIDESSIKPIRDAMGKLGPLTGSVALPKLSILNHEPAGSETVQGAPP